MSKKPKQPSRAASKALIAKLKKLKGQELVDVVSELLHASDEPLVSDADLQKLTFPELDDDFLGRLNDDSFVNEDLEVNEGAEGGDNLQHEDISESKWTIDYFPYCVAKYDPSEVGYTIYGEDETEKNKKHFKRAQLLELGAKPTAKELAILRQDAIDFGKLYPVYKAERTDSQGRTIWFLFTVDQINVFVDAIWGPFGASKYWFDGVWGPSRIQPSKSEASQGRASDERYYFFADE